MAVSETRRSEMVTELLERIGETVGQRAQVSTIFGEPVQRERVTVIPVAKARFGFGGGGGSGSRERDEGSGGGGGGGAYVSPVGYIEVRDNGAEFNRISVKTEALEDNQAFEDAEEVEIGRVEMTRIAESLTGFTAARPPILDAGQLRRIFGALKERFSVASHTEVTVECAPGTLTPVLIETLLACGVNRISLGVQSFVDQETQAVGRLHKRATVLDEIARLRQAFRRTRSYSPASARPRPSSSSPS